MLCKSLWIKAAAKCINVNVFFLLHERKYEVWMTWVWVNDDKMGELFLQRALEVSLMEQLQKQPTAWHAVSQKPLSHIAFTVKICNTRLLNTVPYSTCIQLLKISMYVELIMQQLGLGDMSKNSYLSIFWLICGIYLGILIKQIKIMLPCRHMCKKGLKSHYILTL